MSSFVTVGMWSVRDGGKGGAGRGLTSYIVVCARLISLGVALNGVRDSQLRYASSGASWEKSASSKSS